MGKDSFDHFLTTQPDILSFWQLFKAVNNRIMKIQFTKTVVLAFIIACSILANAQNYQPAPIFGNNGHINFNMSSFAVNASAKSHALQPDGKLVIAGRGGIPNHPNGWRRLEMMRLDPVCGSLDSTFGNNGYLSHLFTSQTFCHDIALQSDGKIVGCGQTNTPYTGYATVFRFNSDGSVDSTFNGIGYRQDFVSGGSVNDWHYGAGMFHSVMIDEEGKIYAAGRGAYGGNPSFVVFRYLPTGDLDSTYGVNGKAIMPISYLPFASGHTAHLLPDGSVISIGVKGIFQNYNYFPALVKFTPDGIPDSTFHEDGYAEYQSLVMVPGNFKELDMDVLSDGRFALTYSRVNPNQVKVALFNANGYLDTGYGEDGVFTYSSNGMREGGIHILPDDRILLFTKHDADLVSGVVVGITSDGQLDTSFGNNGTLIYSYQPDWTGNDWRGFNDGLVLPDGSIFAYGERSGEGFAVTRFTSNIPLDGLPVINYEGDVLTTTTIGSYQWNLNDEPIEGATENNYTPTENGDYTLTVRYAAGCEFTSLPVTVCSNSSAVDVQNACNSFTWIDGNTYTSDNTIATHTLLNAAGCDSIVTLNLIIHQATNGIDTRNACNSFMWIDGNTYTSNNTTATHTLNNSMGCDSIVTLNLTIHTADLSVAVNGNTITANASNASYQWLDCDNNNAPISGATSQSYTPISTGNYAVEITTANCSGISDCSQITIVSVDEWESKNALRVYPNPVSDLLNVSFSNDGKPKHLILTDAMGRTVYSATLKGSSGIITLDMNGCDSGVYILSVVFENGYIQSHQIVKL